MKPARAILIYTLLVVVTGALLAPWLFWAVQATGWEPLTRHPFRRVFNRAVMVTALLGLWPLARALGIRSWSDLGYPRRADWWRDLCAGILLGVASLALGWVVAGKTLDFAAGKYSLPSLMGKLVLTATLVSLIEETFFRGVLQGGLQRSLRWPVACAVTSVIYSALHFLKPRVQIPADAVTWWSGFEALRQVVHGALVTPGVGLAFVSLVFVGWVLGWTFARTKALYLPMGLHAGWVLGNEFVQHYRGGNLVQEPLVWPVVLVTGWLALRWIELKRTGTSDSSMSGAR
ncbi:MAG: CPBP family intramembrane metalloprotease [Verrucomicrobiae bacterium]|nr:CPBP family intramembrane metalloprotease [Verrucomicrobiae bacterium]